MLVISLLSSREILYFPAKSFREHFFQKRRLGSFSCRITNFSVKKSRQNRAKSWKVGLQEQLCSTKVTSLSDDFSGISNLLFSSTVGNEISVFTLAQCRCSIVVLSHHPRPILIMSHNKCIEPNGNLCCQLSLCNMNTNTSHF